VFHLVILRSPASGGTTKNLIVGWSAEILRGVYPEPAEGLRMTPVSFRMDKNQETDGVRLKAQGSRIEID